MHYSRNLSDGRGRKAYALTPNFCALDIGNVAFFLKIHPIRFVEFGTNEEVEISDLLVLPDQCRCAQQPNHQHKSRVGEKRLSVTSEAEFAVSRTGIDYFSENVCWDNVHLEDQ